MPALHFSATARNREPILEVLRSRLVNCRDVLEIACGSGEHAIHFAAAMPHLRWHPTDADPAHVESADAWRQESGVPNVAPARLLDVGCAWDVSPVDVVYCANLIHIAPWEVTLSLFAGARSVLRPGGFVVTYGPYRVDGSHTAPSNLEFDASLRSRDERWGVRDLGEIATATGALERERIPMPANNFTVFWRL